MMNEEEKLVELMGKRNPFRVPEGSFEQLTEQVMKKLPEEQPEKKTIFRSLRPWLYAAACTCVAVFTAALMFNGKNDTTGQQRQMATVEQDYVGYYSDNYIDEEADYAMVDSQDIYAYLLAEM